MDLLIVFGLIIIYLAVLIHFGGKIIRRDMVRKRK